MKQSRANIIGKRFGKLTVVEFSHLDKCRHAFWKCKCDCGGERLTCSRQLLCGKTKSCGCIPRSTGNKNKSWKGHEEISLSYFNGLRKDAIRRSLIFDVTIEQCWDLFLLQNKKCKLSGLPLKFQSRTKEFDGTASLDRIDSLKGYTIDNIQWLHKDVNIMKWDLTIDRFLELVSKIYELENKTL